MLRHSLRGSVLAHAIALAAFGVSGCSSDSDDSDGIWESDAPGSGQGNGSAGLDANAGTGGATGSDGEAAPDASRAIEEADIIKLENGKLYALSQYGGLSVIDVSVRDRLRLLGRHKIVATPFEMYVRDGIVFALYQGYGEYVYDEANGGTAWAQTSHVVALDARNPAAIVQVGKFAIPGYISDSRIVGDILYVAAYEDGYCWGCTQNVPRTVVMSLEVGMPSDVRKVDELVFTERQDTYSWRRSLSSTDQRMYVAGPRWGATEPIGSEIQVIDISDPAGDLVAGATVAVDGQINSRWQMDENSGVLRVISQPWQWDLSTPPSVQTFQVVSSTEVTPLGETTLALPRPEQLQSVRFDGPRGYAITFERTDPLITIDLSNPALPTQAGLLEMPGFVYYMEPRGDRLLGLGFEQGNVAGALHVSLFDVSNIASPTMLSRVNFGGDWAWLAEDQDRIHKAFSVIDSAGLILIPFSGWESSSTVETGYYCYGEYQTGVQLVDWANDALTLRGVAPVTGQARRGFLHDSRLFTMSDDRVETFDIANRDAPIAKTKVALAQNVTRTADAGDSVVRIGQNWWTNTTEVDVMPLNQAGTPTVSAKLELASLSTDGCYSSEWLRDVYGTSERAYLMYDNYAYDSVTGKDNGGTRIVTIDAANPSAPSVAGNSLLDFKAGYNYYYSYELIDRSTYSANAGTTLLFKETTIEGYDNNGMPTGVRSNLRVVDMRNPSLPVLRQVPLPVGLGATGLIVSETTVATSHYEQSPTNPERVRFYADRVVLTDPQNPRQLPSVNVPGSLLAYDAASSNAITVDYRRQTESNVTYEYCYETYGWSAQFTTPSNAWTDDTIGSCSTLVYTLRLVHLGGSVASLLGSLELGPGETPSMVAQGDDRLFVGLSKGYGYGWGYADCFGCGGGYFQNGQQTVVALSGLESGSFGSGRITLETGDYWGYYSPIAASGNRAVLSSGWRGKLSVIDASSVSQPALVREVDISGYVQDLRIIDGVAVASMGYDGVQTIPVDN